MKYTDQVICLRAVSYSETSQVLTLLTRNHGKISAIAKGAKRPKSSFDGPVEPFSTGAAAIAPPARGKELATITEFGQQPALMGLRKNLLALNSAFLAAELIDSMTETDDPLTELFEDFVRFLSDLTASTDNGHLLARLIAFQLNLLYLLGVQLNLNRCANCSAAFRPGWKTAYFSSSAPGLLCPDCETAFAEKRKIAPAAAGALADPAKLTTATAQTLAEIEKILIYHFTELLGKPPKTAKYFQGRKY
jgi:DNA repair protein RecO (recombination protein O)